MTRTALYKKLGVDATNTRWSWSARSGSKIVVNCWQHLFKQVEGQGLTYVFDHDVAAKYGGRELIENLKWARDHNNGEFIALITRARDIDADPKQIASIDEPRLVLKLRSFDEQTGKFTAVIERMI